MCIIVDANKLSSVFNPRAADHSEFKPVFDWVFDKEGMFVLGGSKYKKEASKFMGVFNEFKKMKKAIYFDDKIVDEKEKIVDSQLKHKNFNDQHLVALLQVSGCQLICSNDIEAYPFFRHTTFFPIASKRPRIYRSERNVGLLEKRYIVGVCTPMKILKVKEKIKFEQFF